MDSGFARMVYQMIFAAACVIVAVLMSAAFLSGMSCR